MPLWLTGVADALWRHAPAIVPMALLAAAFCRWAPSRPATRHAIWVTVLALAIVIPFMPDAPVGKLSSAVHSASIAPALSTAVSQDVPFAPAPAPLPPPSDELPPFSLPDDDVVPDFSSDAHCDAMDSDRAEWDVSDEPGFTSVESHHPVRPGTDFAFEVAPATALLCERFERLNHEVDANACAVDARPHFDNASLAEERSRAEPARAIGAGASPDPVSFGERDTDRTASAPVASGGSAPSRRSAWSAWVAGLRQVRDAVGRLPTMPIGVWVAGVVALIALQLLATIVACLRVRRSHEAPASVKRMIQAVASEMNLPSPPTARLVNTNTSPMVFRVPLIGRAWLILPRRLWADLDARGRRAIVCHELAHLRRGDHWFHIGQQLIGALYWWHPVVWWVRRRLSDESERCCDAWVTWLMPDSRRAYAEALLSAKQFVGERRAAMPSGGMALTRAGAKRFARRITNVMTESKRPGLSAASVFIVAGLALTAWISRPAWACPKEEKANCGSTAPLADVIVVPAGEDTFEAHMRAKAAAAPYAVTLPAPPGAPAPMIAVAPPSAGPAPFTIAPSTPLPSRLAYAAPSVMPLQRHLPALAFAGTDDRDDDELEARMKRLEHQMQRLMEMMERQAHGNPTPEPPRQRQAREPREPRAPRAPRPPRDSDSEELSQRPYQLPDGKLEALIVLMSRSDVPVLITPDPGNGQIIVHGTPRQHRIFAAFVDLIHPDGADHADIHDPDHDADHEHEDAVRHRRGASAHQEALERMLAAERMAQQGRGAAHADSARRLKEALEQYRTAAEHAQTHARQSRVQRLELMREIERIEKDRKRLIEQLQKLKARAEKDELSDSDADQQDQLEDQALAMADQAAALAEQADELTEQAESLDAEAVTLLQEAEAVAEEADADAAERAEDFAR